MKLVCAQLAGKISRSNHYFPLHAPTSALGPNASRSTACNRGPIAAARIYSVYWPRNSPGKTRESSYFRYDSAIESSSFCKRSIIVVSNRSNAAATDLLLSLRFGIFFTMTDSPSIGVTHRAEAEKSKHRMLLFAMSLVLLHLLDLKPSDIEAMGLKFSIRDPVVIYGAISLLFGYNFSKFSSDLTKAESLSPLQIGKRKIRYSLITARRIRMTDMKKRTEGNPPSKIKKSARLYLILDDILMLPYRFIAGLFVISAIVFSFKDIYGLTMLISEKYSVLRHINSYFLNM